MAEKVFIKQHRYYWDDADHLIKLAYEYDSQAEDTGGVDSEYYTFWKYRLARMSFIARMMSIEALLNNALEEFSIPEKFKELEVLSKQFPRGEKFPKNRRKRRGRTFQIPMKWKLYLTPYVCNEDSHMEKDEYFDFERGEYRKFRQLIVVRNEFVHTRLADQDIDIQMESQAETSRRQIDDILNEPDYEDCCKEMGLERDPVCFKIDNASVCGRAMKGIILELNNYLGGRILTKDFWESEQLELAT